MKENFYIVLMAGGSGTRLWPMSRKSLPKQFHKFSQNRTLLQSTFDRLKDLAPIDNFYISTTHDIQNIIQKQLPEISNKNYILEPEAKNTAPAIALCAAQIFRRDPQAIIVIISTDHTVTNISNYQKAINSAVNFISKNPDYLVTVGIKPNRPDTGYGYIKVGKKLTKSPLRTGEQFVEKPDLKTAIKYLESGKYLWNAGYFIARTDTLLKFYENHCPEIYTGLRKILAKNSKSVLEKEYNEFSNTSFDTAIAEKVEMLAVVPAENLGWSDVGSWASLYDFLKTDKDSVISEGHHIGIDNQNCLIYAQDKLLATIGLKDIIVVDTPDVTLICHKDKSQDVKILLEKLKKEGKDKYL